MLSRPTALRVLAGHMIQAMPDRRPRRVAYDVLGAVVWVAMFVFMVAVVVGI